MWLCNVSMPVFKYMAFSDGIKVYSIQEQRIDFKLVMLLVLPPCSPASYLCSHNVGSCEGGNFPAWDGATNNHPDEAEDPEGHTHNLNSGRSHSGKDKTEKNSETRR